MGWNPIKDAEKAARRAVDKVVRPAVEGLKRSVNQLGDQVKSGVRNVGQQVEGGVKRVGGEVEGGLKSVGNDIEGGLKRVGGEIEDGVRTAGREVEEGITEKLPDLVEDAIEDVLKAATSDAVKKGLNAALDAIELLSPDSFSLILGFEAALVLQAEFTITVEIPNPTAKLTEIRKWEKAPPKGRSQIIACIKDFGPAALSVEAKFSGNGGNATWSGEEKYDKLDTFLAKHGL